MASPERILYPQHNSFDILYVHQHNSYVNPKPPLVVFGWIAFVPSFLPPVNPRSKVFDMVGDRGTQMVPYEWRYNSYYCRKIIPMVSAHPNDIFDP